MPLSLEQLPWQAQIAVFAGIAGLALVGFHQFYVVPATAELDARARQLRILEGDMGRARDTASRLTALDAEVARLEEQLGSLEAVFSGQKDAGDLLRRIQMTAVESNLTVTRFTPQAIASRELHAEWPIVVELDGTYHDVGRFLERLSRFAQLITVEVITVRAKESQGAHSSIHAECTATTFFLFERQDRLPSEPEVRGAGTSS